MTLLPSQKNDVFRQVRDAEFDPGEFEWVTEERLAHVPSGFWFDFGAGSSFMCTFIPGSDATVRQIAAGGWGAQQGYFSQWLFNVEREVEQPDLWGALKRERELIGGAVPSAAENTPFTREERAEIARQFAEVKTYIKQAHALTEGQIRELESRLDYLVDAANRLPRFDWKNALGGAILGLYVEAVLPPEVVRHTIRMIVRVIGPLFGHDIPELLP